MLDIKNLFQSCVNGQTHAGVWFTKQGHRAETARDIGYPTVHYSGNTSAGEDNQSIIQIILDYLQTSISLEWGLFVGLITNLLQYCKQIQ